MTNDLAQSVLQRSLLGSLSKREQEDVLGGASTISYSPGSLIYDSQLSVIVSGAFGVLIDDGLGRHLTIGYLQTPHSLGVASSAGSDLAFAFQALTESVVLRISREVFLSLQRDHLSLGWAAAHELTHQLDGLLAEVSRIAFQSVRVRVAHHLLALSDLDPGNLVRRAQLAMAVGSGREVVGRSLTEFREAGLIEIRRGGVILLDREGLLRVLTQSD